MIVQQIGNGGAFDYNKTNSSFLINLSNEKFIFIFVSNNYCYSNINKLNISRNKISVLVEAYRRNEILTKIK